jgi:hypothetical protein
MVLRQAEQVLSSIDPGANAFADECQQGRDECQEHAGQGVTDLNRWHKLWQGCLIIQDSSSDAGIGSRCFFLDYCVMRALMWFDQWQRMVLWV